MHRNSNIYRRKISRCRRLIYLFIFSILSTTISAEDIAITLLFYKNGVWFEKLNEGEIRSMTDTGLPLEGKIREGKAIIKDKEKGKTIQLLINVPNYAHIIEEITIKNEDFTKKIDLYPAKLNLTGVITDPYRVIEQKATAVDSIIIRINWGNKRFVSITDRYGDFNIRTDIPNNNDSKFDLIIDDPLYKRIHFRKITKDFLETNYAIELNRKQIPTSTTDQSESLEQGIKLTGKITYQNKSGNGIEKVVLTNGFDKDTNASTPVIFAVTDSTGHFSTFIQTERSFISDKLLLIKDGYRIKGEKDFQGNHINLYLKKDVFYNQPKWYITAGCALASLISYGIAKDYNKKYEGDFRHSKHLRNANIAKGIGFGFGLTATLSIAANFTIFEEKKNYVSGRIF